MHGKDTLHFQSSLCLWKNPTNFRLHRTVCEPFADGSTQVRSPIPTYAHLVSEPFDMLVYMRLYSGKYPLSASTAHHSHLQFSFLVADAFYSCFLHV